MPQSKKAPLVVAMTGASGAYAAHLLLERSPWPTLLVASRWARAIYERECGPFEKLSRLAGRVYDPSDLEAPPSSGSVPTIGMVIVPCSVNSLAHIANGLADNLITRAAHCHLKERRPLILGVRETPLTTIDLANAARAAGAGAVIMPLSPPFFMFQGKTPEQITLHDLMGAYVDRMLALLGRPLPATWEDLT
jgi:polyprenyl P-hydroxybenzoate/phenylacrylic acid decarboxylase-like protein